MNQLLIVFICCVQICTSFTDSHYTAAVIEYLPNTNSTLTSEERTIETVVEYVKLLEEADRSLDIAVFPESTITTGIRTREELVQLSPIILNETIPCKESDVPRYFKDLSCAAEKFQTYLVANIVEKSVCSGETCATDNYNLYNTNVIFDRNGRIIGKYRKFHLFGEFEKNVTETVDITTFTTDFGVTFGTFICFDILFEEPPLWLTRNGTNHIVFPTMWFSEAPFLTALQVQNMFAVATNSIFLSSGANYPRLGSGGTGIFEGVNGPQIMGIVAEGGSKIFVGDVPKQVNSRNKEEKTLESIDESGAKLDGFYLKRDKLEGYNSILISGNVDETYCYEEFCCKFKVRLSRNSTTSENYYRYRIFVYSGVRSFDGTYNGGIEICAMAFCKDETIASCGQRITPYGDIEWATTFESIEISGAFDDSYRKMQYPNSLLSNLEPLDPESYTWRSDSTGTGKIEKELKLVKEQKRLLTFGIYGRDFTRDSAP